MVHNKRKRVVLSIVNIFFRILWLPVKIFAKRAVLKDIIPKNILLVRLDHIGDVLMTSPAFSLLRERFPQTKIILLTNAAGKQLFSDDPRINEILVFNWAWRQQKISDRFSFSKTKELLSLILRLRRERIDVIIDFRGDIRFIILFGLLAGIRIRISNSRVGKSSLLHHISHFDIARHEVERSVDVIECFVKPKTPLRPQIYLKAGEMPAIKEFVKRELKFSEFPSKLALIAPYSSIDIKSWPREYFREVIDSLLEMDFIVTIVGTSDDSADAQSMVKGYDSGVFSLAGKTSVRQLAALTAVSTIIVGVDTGVLHIASCFDTPIIAIFGPTRSVEFRPYSPFSTVVQTNTCSCNQFLHVKCDCPNNSYANCLFNLTPIPVIKALSERNSMTL